MPSHADRVRRQYQDAAVPVEPSLTPRPEALKRSWSELERYAGWLAKDHTSVAVRADVQAVGTAMDSGSDASPSLLLLEKNIGRLQSGDMRKMLKKATAVLRLGLGPTGIV